MGTGVGVENFLPGDSSSGGAYQNRIIVTIYYIKTVHCFQYVVSSVIVEKSLHHLEIKTKSFSRRVVLQMWTGTWLLYLLCCLFVVSLGKRLCIPGGGGSGLELHVLLLSVLGNAVHFTS